MYLIHIISSNKWGEAQRYALDICRHYHDAGAEVMAVTRDAQVVDSRFAECGIPLSHAPLRGFFDPASAFVIARMLRKIPRDEGIVHVHRYRDAFTILLAKRIAKRPDIRVVSTRHTVRRGRNSWLFRRVYNKINAHIFVSNAAFMQFRSSWHNLPMDPARVHILHNGVNIPDGEPQAEPSKGPVTAVYYGPVVRGKGIETIIDALAQLRGVKLRLRISGRGVPDYLDDLRRRAMARGVMDSIDWCTARANNRADVVNAHFAVLPSIEREAFGLANLEVMACGRPQICTSNGAQREYLADGRTALFIPPADSHRLAEAMRRLAEDAEMRRRIGAEAHAVYVDSLSWPAFTCRLSEIYRNL